MKLKSLLLPGLMLFPASAWAHVGAGEASGWAAGFTHPLFGWDHLLAILAVGLLATKSEDRLHWEFPLTFVSFLGLFAWIGIRGGFLPYMEHLIALSVILFGLLLALPKALPSHWVWLFTALSAACHGLAHGQEATGLAYAYLGGMLLTSCLLHASGLGLGVYFKRTRPLALRALGLGTGIAGILILAGTLSP